MKIRWSSSAGVQNYRLARLAPEGNVSVPSIAGNIYVDTSDILPGQFYIYELFAQNAVGETEAGFDDVRVFIPSDICTSAGLPGSFSMFSESPYCDSGEPAVRINWTPPPSVNSIQRWLLTTGTASGSVNTTITGFTKLLKAGISAGRTLGAFVQVAKSSDASKTRESNWAYFAIPAGICGVVPAPPVVSTGLASSRRSDRALLEGFVEPRNLATAYALEYGATDAYGQSTLGYAIEGGADTVRVGHVVSGLECSTEYHFRVVAQNQYGPAFGSDATFTTGPCNEVFTDGFESGGLGPWSSH